MLKKITLLFVNLILVTILSYSQLTQFKTILNPYFSKPEVSGFMYFQTPNNLQPGNCFQYYKNSAGDINNDMVLEKDWVDPQLSMHHYYYQQTYNGVPVENAGCIEHFDSLGSLVVTNAKHAVNLNVNTNPSLSEDQAFKILMNYLPSNYVFAWEDMSWEIDLKINTGDSTVTHKPDGILELILDNYNNLNFNIDGSRYTLAYKFEVLIINPFKYNTYWVDAQNGTIIKEKSNTYDDGPATIYNAPLLQTVQTIDTKERGWPNNDWVLKADNFNKSIHTKYKNSALSWILVSEITDNDDDWIGSNEKATTVHWYVQRAWDFFKERYGIEGTNNANENIRVHIVTNPINQFNAQFIRHSGVDNLLFFTENGSNDYSGEYAEVVAHEYSHAIKYHTVPLNNSGEAGALAESFGDIFGVLFKNYLLGSYGNTNFSWITAQGTTAQRQLDQPKLSGNHIEVNNNICSIEPGQPNTYQGDYWYYPSSNVTCFDDGIHGNNGVQNYWFYLLTEGGTGVNDNNDSYIISGIGKIDAGKIAFFNMQNFVFSGSNYNDARQGAVTAAWLLFGECSLQHYETANAWYAAGVGTQSTCTEVLKTNTISLDEVSVYPNPFSNNITVNFKKSQNFTIKLFNITGKLVYSNHIYTSNATVSLPDLSRGVYIVELKDENTTVRKKIIKQ